MNPLLESPNVDADAPSAKGYWPLPPEWQKCVINAAALEKQMTALSVALSERKGSGHSTVLERAHRAYSTALIQELEKAVRFYGRAEKMCQAILCRARADVTSLLDGSHSQTRDFSTHRTMLVDLKRLTAELVSLEHFSLASCHELGVILARHDQISGLSTRDKFMEKIGSQPLVRGTSVKRMIRDCHELFGLAAGHMQNASPNDSPGPTTPPPPLVSLPWAARAAAHSVESRTKRPLGLGTAEDASPSEAEARVLLALRHGTTPTSVSPSPPPHAATANSDPKRPNQPKKRAEDASLMAPSKRARALKAQPPLAQPQPRVGTYPSQAVSSQAGVGRTPSPGYYVRSRGSSSSFGSVGDLAGDRSRSH